MSKHVKKSTNQTTDYMRYPADKKIVKKTTRRMLTDLDLAMKEQFRKMGKDYES